MKEHASTLYRIGRTTRPHSKWHCLNNKQVAHLSQRDRAAGWVTMAKVEDWNWETIITDIIGLYSTMVTYLASKAIEFCEKRNIRAITLFKVIQSYRSRYQSKARMRLLISD